MAKLTRIFVFLSLLVALCACDMSARQIQAHTADAIGNAANSALPILLSHYRQEGLDAIQAASTKAEAETELAAIKLRWEPVWKAWESVRIAQNAWATSLEAGADTAAALSAVRTAYCELQGVWPIQLAAMPIAPVACGASQ